MSAKRKRPRSGQGGAAAKYTSPNSSPTSSSLPRPLDQKHRDELYASGLTDDTIAAAGIYSADGQAITDILGWKPKDMHWSRCMVFRYPGIDPAYCRVKPDYARPTRGGGLARYESPRNSGNRAYLSASF